MKRIFLLVLVTIQVLAVLGQSCDRKFVPVFGIFHTAPYITGVELGVKGEDSKIDLLFGITYAYRKTKEQKSNNIEVSPGMYWKTSYRIYRVDYVYSAYGTMRYILDTESQLAPGISMLFHVRKMAIAIDPYYTMKTNKLYLQTTLYLKL